MHLHLLICVFAGYTSFCHFAQLKYKTRAVKGSDYSPATALSDEKDKLVTENWKDREKKFPRIIPKPHAHFHSMQNTSAKL